MGFEREKTPGGSKRGLEVSRRDGKVENYWEGRE